VKRLALAVGLGLVLLATGLAAGLVRPWDRSSASGDEVRVDRATLRPGKVELVVVNDSEESARVAQVIVNDAFVGFQQNRGVLAPGASERITVPYLWISGESYEVRLMTSTGATIDYELEDAGAGTRET
jgi:ZIP family zinc transporter